MQKISFFTRACSISLVAAMLISMTACGNSTPSSSVAPPVAPSSSQENSPPTPAPPASSAIKGDDHGTGAVGENGGVASSSPYASQIGLDILKAGGNAVDAAVATVFAIGVVEPEMSGIGGCGIMNVYMEKDQRNSILEFMETTPLASFPGMMDPKNQDDANSGKNVAIPGQVHGLLTALEQYGTMTPEQVLAPVIKLAEEGYVLDKNLYGFIGLSYDRIIQDPELKSIYTDEGIPLSEGAVIKNPNLAKTLTAISKGGIKEFYEGETAKKIVEGLQKTGSLITMEDMAIYKTLAHEPISTTYQGYEIVTPPPPSNGGMWLLETLNIMETMDMKAKGHNTTEYILAQNEASRLGMIDSFTYIGDPAFFELPTQTIISKDYAAERAKLITDKAMPNAPAGDLPVKRLDATADNSKHTSHVSVMDKDGNVVSVTTTLGNLFGSAVAIEGMGFAFNSHMSNLEHDPAKADSPDYIMPGKRVRTTIAPTIVLKDKEPVMAIGSPGSFAIPPAIATVLNNMFLFDMNIHEAINAPRANVVEFKPALFTETGRFDEAAKKALADAGYTIQEAEDMIQMGCIAAVCYDPETKTYNAAGDFRRGYKGLAY